MGTIYAICNEISGKVYIGQTKAVPAIERWKSHLSTFRTLKRIGPNRHQNWTKIYLAMKSYGVDNFTFIEIHECPDELLSVAETYFINLLDTINNGYNIVEKGRPPTYTELTDEQKENHAKGLKDAWADPNSFFHTEEYKKLRSDGMKRAWADKDAYTNSDQARQNRSNAQKGKKWSDVSKDKLAKSLKGNTFSRKRVTINGVSYDSCIKAAEACGVTNVTITQWIKNGKATVINKENQN